MAGCREIIPGTEPPGMTITNTRKVKKLSYKWDYWFPPYSDAHRLALVNSVSLQTYLFTLAVPKLVEKKASTHGNMFYVSWSQGTFVCLNSCLYLKLFFSACIPHKLSLSLFLFSCPKNVKIIKSFHFYYASVSSNSLTDISYNWFINIHQFYWLKIFYF